MKQWNYVILTIFLMALTMLSTMWICVGLPTDEHVLIQNRALNYFDKPCYDMDDIEMIVFGEVLYDKRYIDNKQ